MKKTSIPRVPAMCMALIVILTIFASATMTWYATVNNEDWVAYIPSTFSRYSYKNLGQTSSTNTTIQDYLYDAVVDWRTGVGISLTANSSNTSSSNAFVLYAGSLDELQNYTLEVDANTPGYTDFGSNYTLVDRMTIDGIERSIAEFTGTVRVFVSTDESQSKWRRLVNHEIGHAFGYVGHSANSGDLMNASVNSSVNTPQTNDIAHLSQFYDIYR